VKTEIFGRQKEKSMLAVEIKQTAEYKLESTDNYGTGT
jgi:hypothetical protein